MDAEIRLHCERAAARMVAACMEKVEEAVLAERERIAQLITDMDNQGWVDLIAIAAAVRAGRFVP